MMDDCESQTFSLRDDIKKLYYNGRHSKIMTLPYEPMCFISIPEMRDRIIRFMRRLVRRARRLRQEIQKEITCSNAYCFPDVSKLIAEYVQPLSII